MATFEAQVESLTGIAISGSSNPTQTELSSFLVDGVIDVVNRMIITRPEELPKFTKTTNDTSSVTKAGKVLSVMREHDSTSILRPCTQINSAIRYEATDVDSLHYRSKYSPGFYELNGLIHTVPAAGSGNNDIVVTQVHYDTGLVYGDTYNAAAIENFPKDYEYLVAIYAAIQSLHSKMVNTSITALAITAVPPDVPNAPSFAYDNAIASTAIALVTTTIAEANNYIDNDEDVELANAKLSEVSNTIQDARLRMDNELNEYKSEIDEYTQKLAKYQAELGAYNANITNQVQEFSNNLTKQTTEYKWMETQLRKLQIQYETAFKDTPASTEGQK